MAYVNVQSNGVAPSGLSVGDVVKTAGKNNYQIVSPGTPGANYSKDSGYWSIPVSKDHTSSSSSKSAPVVSFGGSNDDIYKQLMSSATQLAAQNNKWNADQIKQQMQFQEDANAKLMAFNSAEAQKNRDWQEQMSNSAHQREVNDLMAAGLNPVLSAMGGAGASTPSGAAASGATSSGGAATADTSQIQALASIANSIINQKTNLEVARLNRDSQISVASINAKSAANVANIHGDVDKYLAANYPSNVYQAAGFVGRGIGELVKDGFGDTSAKVTARVNSIAEKISDGFSKLASEHMKRANSKYK